MKSYDPVLFPFQSKWVNIGGNNIHYVDEGKGEIILFFHPPIASSFMYRHMIKSLRSNYRCIAPDFPGFGLSSMAEGFRPSIQSFSIIIGDFIKILDLHHFYFVMQEVGGHAAVMAILRQPADLKGIILTDTIIFPVSQYPKISGMLKMVNSGIFNFINSNFNFLIRLSTRIGFGQRKLTRQERVTYIKLFDTKEKRKRTTSLLYELTDESMMKKIQTAFETTFMNSPALIIYGEKDSLTALGIPQRISMIMKKSELHFIKGEGHFPHEGAPEELCNLIQKWIYH